MQTYIIIHGYNYRYRTWYWYTGCQKFAFCEPEEHDGVLVKHTGTGETILEKIT